MVDRRQAGSGQMRRGGRGAPVSPWTPSVDSGLEVWYRGQPGDVVLNGSDIDEHIDLAGTRNAKWAGAASRPAYSASLPLLGQPGGLYVRANSDWLDTSVVGALTIPQPYTIVAAVAFNTDPATLQEPFGATANWFTDTFGGQLRMYGGTAAVNCGALSANTPYVFVLAFNGATSRARVNGVTTYSGATNIGTASMTRILLGRGATGAYLDGEIAEFLVFSGNLVTGSAGRLANVEAYMSAKYL